MYDCNIHAKYEVCLLLFETGLTEHAGESEVQFSVGAKMEAYDDQAAAAKNQFCCKFKEKTTRKRCD